MNNNKIISIKKMMASSRNLVTNEEEGIENIGARTTVRETVVNNKVVSEKGFGQTDNFQKMMSELKFQLQHHTTSYMRYEMDE